MNILVASNHYSNSKTKIRDVQVLITTCLKNRSKSDQKTDRNRNLSVSTVAPTNPVPFRTIHCHTNTIHISLRFRWCRYLYKCAPGRGGKRTYFL